MDDVKELETLKLVLDLVNFHTVGVHVFSVAVPGVVHFVDDH